MGAVKPILQCRMWHPKADVVSRGVLEHEPQQFLQDYRSDSTKAYLYFFLTYLWLLSPRSRVPITPREGPEDVVEKMKREKILALGEKAKRKKTSQKDTVGFQNGPAFLAGAIVPRIISPLQTLYCFMSKSPATVIGA